MIILDTHILVWLDVEEFEKIPKKMFMAIDSCNELGVSAISLWEISMLVQKNRIDLKKKPLEWFNVIFSNPRIKLLPITSEIAAVSGELDMHGDPADRIIAATSIAHKSKLATIDSKLCELACLDIVR